MALRSMPRMITWCSAPGASILAWRGIMVVYVTQLNPNVNISPTSPSETDSEHLSLLQTMLMLIIFFVLWKTIFMQDTGFNSLALG
jgi:hypothetical protein